MLSDIKLKYIEQFSQQFTYKLIKRATDSGKLFSHIMVILRSIYLINNNLTWMQIINIIIIKSSEI